MNHRFDADTSALQQRVEINQAARYNLEDWIVQQIDFTDTMRVLDLGCGTGKQVFALQKLLSAESSILGIDISPDAVSLVNTRAQQEKLHNVEARECHLDDVVSSLEASHFDLILSSYAIYYSQDMVRLLSTLPTLLNPGGQVFICGNGRGTNQEIYDIIRQFSDRGRPVDDFIHEEDIVRIGRKHYANYRITRLANQVTFTSLESILGWWKHHNSFIPEILQDVSQSLEAYLARDGSFSLTKNVLGVSYHVE